MKSKLENRKLEDSEIKKAMSCCKMPRDLSGLYRSLEKTAIRLSASWEEYGRPLHHGIEYPLFRFSHNLSQNISNKKNVLIISAGIHGEEPAGSFAIKYGLNGIAEAATKRGLGLIVYPCVNPSGFEHNTRYNADNEHPNNDFVRYQKMNGEWVDDLKSDVKAVRDWKWSADAPLDKPLPKETLYLLKDLKRLEHQGILSRVSGLIDIHQDDFRKDMGTYAYVFGDRTRYAGLMEKFPEELGIPLLRNKEVSSGYRTEVDGTGGIVSGDSIDSMYPQQNLYSQQNFRVIHSPDQTLGPRTDGQGLLTRYDGSLCDLFDNLGTKISVTIETTTTVPLAKAIMVNWMWIKHVMELIQGKNGAHYSKSHK